MSSSDKTPAFPVNELNENSGDICAQHFGMTLLDFFAASFPEATVSPAGAHFLMGRHPPSVMGEEYMEYLAECEAKWRYMRAASMIKVRSA
jgi:hypothetical protein